VTIGKIVAGELSGDGLLRWKLSQKVAGNGLWLSELLEICERDLDLRVKVISAKPTLLSPPNERTIAEWLDGALRETQRYWKVRDAGIVIGTLEELTK